MMQFQSTPQATIQQFQALANQVQQFEAQNEQLLQQLRQVESQNASLLNQLAQREQQAQQQIRQLVQTGLQIVQQIQAQQYPTQHYQSQPNQGQYFFPQTQFSQNYPQTQFFGHSPYSQQFSQFGQLGTSSIGQSLNPQSFPQFV